MNSNSVNLPDYYSNHVFLHNFAWSNVGKFWAWLVKMWYHFYYANTNSSALSNNLVSLEFWKHALQSSLNFKILGISNEFSTN